MRPTPYFSKRRTLNAGECDGTFTERCPIAPNDEIVQWAAGISAAFSSLRVLPRGSEGVLREFDGRAMNLEFGMENARVDGRHEAPLVERLVGAAITVRGSRILVQAFPTI